jgi:hypothetical protein
MWALALVSCDGRPTILRSDAGAPPQALDARDAMNGADASFDEGGAPIDAAPDRGDASLNPAQGELLLEWIDVTPRPLAAGQTLSFRFSAQTDTNIAADFKLTLDTDQPTWSAQFASADGTRLPSDLLSLGTRDNQQFLVQIMPPAGTTSGTTFLLGVSTLGGYVEGTTGLLPFTIGQDAPAPDPGLQLLFVTQDSAGPSGVLVGNTVAALLGGGVTLTFDVVIAPGVDDTFSASTNQLAGTQGWNLNVDEGTFSGAGTTSSLMFTIGAGALPTPTESGLVSVTLTNDRTGLPQTRVFAVQLVDALPR